jgi:hypothetical protein
LSNCTLMAKRQNMRIDSSGKKCSRLNTPPGCSSTCFSMICLEVEGRGGA